MTPDEQPYTIGDLLRDHEGDQHAAAAAEFARAMKRYHDALVAAGFTSLAALTLTSAYQTLMLSKSNGPGA